MERKTFIAAAAGVAGAVGAARAAAADDIAPERFDQHSDRNIVLMSRLVGLVVEDLQQDAHDYGGFRVKAIQSLEQARDQLHSALLFEEKH
jgi:hypothetical protein